MTDVERLLAAFEAGTLLRPTPSEPSLVDLARVLAAVAGADGLHFEAGAAEVASIVGEPDHLVFIMADGLGCTTLDAEPDATFLHQHYVRELRSLFPATTAVALTSLATGAWPAQHAITGWWTHLPEIGSAATILPFIRRSDERSLVDLEVDIKKTFPVPSLWERMTRDVLCVQPDRIAGSVYSQYSTAGSRFAGYNALREGVNAVLGHVDQARTPTYTYLYIPHVDGASHEYGLNSPELRAALLAVDMTVRLLAEALEGRARIVLTADHGHLPAPQSGRHRIRSSDGFSSLLKTAPAGDPRTLHFHVRPGREEQFAHEFRSRFAERFALLTVDEVDELRLFGPDPLTEETRLRLGDFVAISLGADILAYLDANGGRDALRQASQHSGLTPEEMRIPLIVV